MNKYKILTLILFLDVLNCPASSKIGICEMESKGVKSVKLSIEDFNPTSNADDFKNLLQKQVQLASQNSMPLKYVFLKNCILSDEEIKQILALPNVTHIVLRDCEKISLTAITLPENSNLKKFVIFGAPSQVGRCAKTLLRSKMRFLTSWHANCRTYSLDGQQKLNNVKDSRKKKKEASFSLAKLLDEAILEGAHMRVPDIFNLKISPSNKNEEESLLSAKIQFFRDLNAPGTPTRMNITIADAMLLFHNAVVKYKN